MKTIRKKDIFNYKTPENVFDDEEINEFVDADGAPIEDKMPSKGNDQIYTAPQQTTDDFVSATRQPGQQMGFLTGGGAHGTSRLREEENSMPMDNNQNTLNNKPAVLNKVTELILTVSKNGLTNEEKIMVLNLITQKLNIQNNG